MGDFPRAGSLVTRVVGQPTSVCNKAFILVICLVMKEAVLVQDDPSMPGTFL